MRLAIALLAALSLTLAACLNQREQVVPPYPTSTPDYLTPTIPTPEAPTPRAPAAVTTRSP